MENMNKLGLNLLSPCRFLNPIGMVLGGAVVSLVFVGSVWAAENKSVVKNFKKRNPMLFVMAVLGASYMLLSLCEGVMVFIFGISFPLLSVFLRQQSHYKLR